MMSKVYASPEKFLIRSLQKTKYAAEVCRKLEFSITITDVMSVWRKQNGKCAITGWPMDYQSGGEFKGGKNPLAVTVDRIDNSLGYIKDNIQLVCTKANFLRGKDDLNDFISFCTAVANAHTNQQLSKTP